MGHQSQSGSVGFRTQSAKGAYLDPGSGGIFMRTRKGALGGSRDLLIPDAEIGGNRDIADAHLGPIKFVGDYEFYVRMDSFATLLAAALGDTSSASAGAGTTLVGTHTITPIDDAALPWLSIEENIAADFEHFRYTDAKVNSLKVEVDSEGYLSASAGLVALTQIAVPGASATASPEFDTGPMTVGSNVTVSWGGTQLPAKSFSFEVANNLEDSDFRLGSLFLGDTTEKRREFNIGCNIRPEDSDMWRQAMYGDPAATQAGGTVTLDDVEVNCETYEFIGTTLTVYSFGLVIPTAVIAPFEVSPSGDDAIAHDLEIKCLRPDPDVPILTATVVNHLASVV